MGIVALFVAFSFTSCQNHIEDKPDSITHERDQRNGVWLIILGTVQDGGSPHIGCAKDCCKALFMLPDSSRKVVALGIIDYAANKRFLFEATPDMPAQLRYLRNQPDANFSTDMPDGILLTHAHIGHYAGLMYLGREALGAHSVPVYAMPRMKSFLETNGPWSQLVNLENIVIHEMQADTAVQLTENVQVIPFRVPHRDEYSETVGFKIIGPKKSVLFIPDIDKWEKWDKNIVAEIEKVDHALVDATFYTNGEIERNMAEVPHPFAEETINLLSNLPESEKGKVIFIHFNHTNPLINPLSAEADSVRKMFFNVAELGDEFAL